MDRSFVIRRCKVVVDSTAGDEGDCDELPTMMIDDDGRFISDHDDSFEYCCC